MKRFLLIPALISFAVAQETPLPSNNAKSQDAKQQFLDPFPAKPTGDTPKGWEIILLENSKAESKTQIEPGKDIDISVQAYQLVPASKGQEGQIWNIQDPQYNPLLKNAQERTLGATITKFSEECEVLRKALQDVTSSLEKSLKESPISGDKPLPTSEAVKKPEPTPKQKKP